MTIWVMNQKYISRNRSDGSTSKMILTPTSSRLIKKSQTMRVTFIFSCQSNSHVSELERVYHIWYSYGCDTCKTNLQTLLLNVAVTTETLSAEGEFGGQEKMRGHSGESDNINLRALTNSSCSLVVLTVDWF